MAVESLAVAAVALLAPYLAKAGEEFAQRVSTQVYEKTSALYRVIKSKFVGDDYAEKTLARIAANPASQAAEATLRELLEEKLRADPAFAETVRGLVDEARAAAAPPQVVSGNRAIGVGGNASGNTFVTGDRNVIGDRSLEIGGDAIGANLQLGDHDTASLRNVSTASAEAGEIRTELAALREALARLNAPDQRKVENALADAEAELEKPDPDKDEVGTAIDRALGYARKAEGFARIIDTLKPSLTSVAAWLGSNWDKLLAGVSRPGS